MRHFSIEANQNAYHLSPSWGTNPGSCAQNQTTTDELSSTTYSPSIIRFVLESQSEFQHTYIPDTIVLRLFTLGAK